jgi:hypothetical protein
MDAFDDDLKELATSLKIEKGHSLDRGSLSTVYCPDLKGHIKFS